MSSIGTMPVVCTFFVAWLQVIYIVGINAGSYNDSALPDRKPLIIAHRGSSGVLPEHTVAAYRRAIDNGADYVECDVTLTQDLVPVCLHENWLNETTDVATRPEFASMRRRRQFGSNESVIEVYDWFAVDFTLAQLKTLKTRQRFEFRDQSHNGIYSIATFEEHLSTVRDAGRIVGTYPELKDPQWLNSLDILKGRKFEDIFLDTLTRNGITSRNDPCIIQSFSEESLYYLANRTDIRLAMLIENDVPVSKISEWSSRGIYVVGPWINLITRFWIQETGYKNWINSTTSLVQECHRHGLVVHAWTFRNEDRYLPWDFEQDITQAYDYYIQKMLVDGFFTDFPKTLAMFRRNLQDCKQSQPNDRYSGFSAISFETNLIILPSICAILLGFANQIFG